MTGLVSQRSGSVGGKVRLRRCDTCRFFYHLGTEQAHLPTPYLRFAQHWPVNLSDLVAHHSGPGLPFQSVDVNTVIHNPLVYYGVVGDVHRVVNDGYIAGSRHDNLFYAGTEKQRFRDKTPGVLPYTEFQIRRREAYAGCKLHCWRQWRPTNETIPGAPAYPGRSPHSARYPGPATVVVVKKPATIMEGNPTPGLVRDPGPAKVIGENPISQGIRLPIGCYTGVPDPAIGSNLPPLAIRRQLVVEKADVYAHPGLGRRAAQEGQAGRINGTKGAVH